MSARVIPAAGGIGSRILGKAERAVQPGFVAPDDDGFAAHAVALLTDGGLWRRQQEACLARQRAWTWDRAAEAFEALIP